MLRSIQSRSGSVFAGLLAILGSILFAGGGRLHPHVNSDMGPLGSDIFYRHFIAEIARTQNWEGFHTLILAGPLLWAVALATFGYTMDAKRRPFWQAATQAFAIGGAVWAACFVLDGFVTPMYARALSPAANPMMEAILSSGFRANQQAVARLGAVSWFAMSFGTAIVGGLMLSRFREAPKTGIVGAFGATLGTWGVVACLSGEFVPAPFTSHYWTLTALAQGLWFVALGVVMIAQKTVDHRVADDSTLQLKPASSPVLREAARAT